MVADLYTEAGSHLVLPLKGHDLSISAGDLDARLVDEIVELIAVADDTSFGVVVRILVALIGTAQAANEIDNASCDFSLGKIDRF